ncbi:hypothetical protein NXC14_PA00460 (plasmid) [Rhizobium sp. NXC14]|nr:hypothetical protein NXC14_PA00460 [Rhizobium sp. NXC14]
MIRPHQQPATSRLARSTTAQYRAYAPRCGACHDRRLAPSSSAMTGIASRISDRARLGSREMSLHNQKDCLGPKWPASCEPLVTKPDLNQGMELLEEHHGNS